MGASSHRAWVLYFEMKRYDLAERELRGVLVDRPGDAVSHSLLSLCLTQRQQYQEAAHEVKEAVRLGPNLAFAHYARARLLGARNQLSSARTAIQEAIRLDPMQADYFSWLAAFLYDSGNWKAALKAADKGLELHALHVSCANLRALSLAKLGRRKEAQATSEAALARDPVNAISHAIRATTLMRQAEYGQARATYMEALRLDPMCEWAHRGRANARSGYMKTLPALTIGRGLFGMFRWVDPRVGEASDKSAAWFGGIILVALSAAAAVLVDHALDSATTTLGFGLAALLLVWVGSSFRHCGFLMALGFASLLPAGGWLLGMLNSFNLTHHTSRVAELLRLTAYAASGAATIGIVSFLFGVSQAGFLADMSLPRRKPEKPPSARP